MRRSLTVTDRQGASPGGIYPNTALALPMTEACVRQRLICWRWPTESPLQRDIVAVVGDRPQV